MRFAPISILSNESMTASFKSKGIDLNQIVSCSIQAVWSGTLPVGEVYLEVSNDNVPVAAISGNPVSTDPAANVVNWSKLTISATKITDDGNFLWDLPQLGFHWVRLAYDKTSGSGSMSATASVKGV